MTTVDATELGHLLRCIECASPLDVPGSMKGALLCPACGREYPIVDATPRMLRAGAREATKRRTAASFAYEWARFGHMRPEWRKNFLDYLAPLTPDDLRGTLLLDVGTGSGRHSYHAAAAGARVIAVDIGASIDVARRNLPPEALTVQADADALPFAPETFDVVMAIGVLHHLSDPDHALAALVRLVRPQGHVHVYLYWVGEHVWHRVLLRGVSLARALTVRLPHVLLEALCYPIAIALYGLFVAPYRAARRLGLSGLARWFPLKVYAEYPFAVLVNDQFDRFSAPIEHRYTRDQVADMLTKAGLEDVVVLASGGWVADGRKPARVPSA